VKTEELHPRLARLQREIELAEDALAAESDSKSRRDAIREREAARLAAKYGITR
jgi:hypothetical protein